MYPLHNITPTIYSEWRSPLLSLIFSKKQKHSAINHLWTTMITQTSRSIYNYWTKIIASKSKTIAITTFAITNDTSELIFFSKSIFRIFQITLILLYNLQHVRNIRASFLEHFVPLQFTNRTSRKASVVSRPVWVAGVVELYLHF